MLATKLISKKMLNKGFVFTCLIICSSLYISCKKSVREDTQSKITADSLQIKIKVLQDSVRKTWDEMIRDDDEKLGFMRRALLEISYSNFRLSRIEELQVLVDQLKAMRYDQQTMASSALIDQYDSATNVVTRQVIDFSYEFLEKNENDLIEKLMSEINQKNNYVLIYRVHYDVFAEELNNLIDRNRQEIENMEIAVEKFPLFKLPVEEI